MMFVKLLKSRTFWVNVIGGILQIVNILQGQAIPAEYAVAIQGVLNIIVRLLTNKPIAEK